MTQPSMAGPPVPEDEAVAAELAAVASVVGPVAAAVSAALAVATVAVAGGAITGAAGTALAAAIAHRLRTLTWPPMADRLPIHLDNAVRFGVRTALDTLPARTRPDAVQVSPPDNVPDLDTKVRTKLEEAAAIADTMSVTTRRDLETIAGRARSGVAQAQGAVRFGVNHGINSGTADVARAAGQRVIWVAERNACLHCLAYAGWATEPDQEFPHGLSFDPAGGLRPFGVLLWPPLHPNCRCRVRLYDGPAGPPPADRSLPDPAARLAGEARRSVVYQWTDYASGAAMRRAAAALLDQGAGLADSVERRARAALRAGRAVRRPR